MLLQVIVILTVLQTTNGQQGLSDIAPAEVIWTEKDGTAELPCNGDNNYTGVAMILWFKGKTGVPLYTIDIRGRKNAVHSALTSNLGMRSYYVEGDPGYLRIQSITPEDAGIYRCRIDYINSPTYNFRVNLSLIEAPSEPNIYFEDGDDVRDVAGPYLEGREIRLTCTVHGGVPHPTVYWLVDGEVLEGVDGKKHPGDVFINRLYLGSVTRNLHGKTISCQALSAKGTKPKTRSVTVSLYLRPTSVKILSAPGYMSSGTIHQCLCVTQGSLPPANITWLIDGEPIRNSVISVKIGSKETSSVLNLKAQWSDDGKVLTCKASNSKYPHFHMSEDRHLKVGYPPIVSVRILSDSQPNVIQEGDDVTLLCEVKSNPPVYSVLWYHRTDAYPMSTSDSDLNHELHLRNISMNQAGEYSCLAKNNEGTTRSRPAFLRVRHAPVCKEGEQRKSIGLLKNQAVFLSCEVEANPNVDLKFRWTFNNSKDVLPLPASWMKTAGSVSFFNYTPATDLDFGTLGCWAENEVGKQREPCLTDLIQGSLPPAPSDCEVTHNNATDKLRLVCLPSGGDYFATEHHYVVDVNEIPSEEQTSQGVMGDQGLGPPLYRILSDSSSFNLDKLKPNRDYKLEIYTKNVYGLSHPPYVISGVRYPQKEASVLQQNFSYLDEELEPAVISALITIAGLIVLLSIILTTAYKYSRKKHREKIQKPNNIPLNNLGPSIAGIRDSDMNEEESSFIDT